MLTFSDPGETAAFGPWGLVRGIVVMAFAGFIATGFLGCAAKRSSYDVPTVPLPAAYKNSLTENALATASSSDKSIVKSDAPDPSQDAGLSEWWRSFGNAELVELIDRGLANNQDVRIATLRLAQAKTRVDQASAGLLPSITAPIGMAMQAPGGAVGGGIPVGTASRAAQISYQASVRGTWRADVWGEQRSLVESATFHLWQASFDRDNVQRLMTASIASSYIELLSLNDRLRIAREIEAVMSGMLATVEKRVEVGDATLIELDQQKAGLFATRAAIPSLEQQREDVLTSIAFLLGTVPGALKTTGDGLNSLSLPDVIPALPASLLFRRPDVRLAESRLLAADADVDVARARLLPPVDLSSQAGYSALAVAGLFQPSSLFWNAIASLTASIFDGGKLASEMENAKAIHEEMVETYARAILQAVKEVETALVGIRMNRTRLDYQRQVIASARRAWDSNAQMYAVGGVDHMALLDAERNYQRYLDELQRLRMELYRGYINLFQAVGGGVHFSDPLPGKGARPSLAEGSNAGSGLPVAPGKQSSASQIEWAAKSVAEMRGVNSPRSFWQVELPGLYHRSTIEATWRDLRARYPERTENRLLQPRLHGRIAEAVDSQVSWYRLHIGEFESADAAHQFCAALQADYQRCRVISSVSDETIVAPSLMSTSKAPSTAGLPRSE